MRLTQFGATRLDYFNAVEDVGSGVALSSYVNLPLGGALDAYGDRQTAPGATETVKRVRLYGRTAIELENQLASLRALRGKRDKLYVSTYSGDIRWMYARLTAVVGTRTYDQRYPWTVDVELRFVLQDAYWRGGQSERWYLNSGVLLNTGYHLNGEGPISLGSSPASLTVNNGAAGEAGRAPVRAMTITVWPGSAPITSIEIVRLGAGNAELDSLTYTGTIPANGQLVIDTGLQRVTCTGVTDAYGNLAFAPTTDMASWFTLEPGPNTIAVVYTGGGTGKQIQFSFYEAWY